MRQGPSSTRSANDRIPCAPPSLSLRGWPARTRARAASTAPARQHGHRHHRDHAVVAGEVRCGVPGEVTRPAHLLRDQPKAACREAGGNERPPVGPAAAQGEVELQAEPTRFAHGVAHRLVPGLAEVRPVAHAARGIVHREGIDRLDLGAPQAGVPHEGQLAGDLLGRDRAPEPPPAGHGLGRLGRIGEGATQVGELRNRPGRGAGRRGRLRQEKRRGPFQELAARGHARKENTIGPPLARTRCGRARPRA